MKKVVIFLASTLTLVLVSLGLWYFMPKPPLLEGVEFSTVVYDKHHRLLRLTLSKDDKYRLYTPLSQIPISLINATLLKEDEYFYLHAGINPAAMSYAFWQTYITQGKRRGASTITMQVAKLRNQLYTQSIFGKIKQMLIAMQLERHYSKQEILEAYLNLAPYGNNIEGVGAASLIYYHESPQKITLLQALTLSVIPQSPGRRSLNNLNYNEILQSRWNLFQRWIQRAPNDIKYQSLMDLPIINFKRADLPFNAPHFVTDLLQHTKVPNQHEINTTLDTHLQKLLEKIMIQYVESKKNVGIQNASALLVDVHDMSVTALIGSVDFLNKEIQGQVNGTTAKRSPGSALKPLVYALAIDQGLIHPATVLKDAPMSFGSYNPENFDYDFLGPLSAKQALIESRNIPAIFLANQLKKPNFYQFLSQTDLALKSEHEYGLSLVLGGVELSMQDLVELYAMLANQGVLHRLRFTQDAVLDTGKILLSREASYLVLDMLKETPALTPANIPVAWKTGTSSGYRDAWVVGIFSHYVLAVWVGNFSGQGNKAFSGRDAAAPLFFRLLEALNNELPKAPFISDNWQDLAMSKVLVCKASGKLPTHACPHTLSTWFIPGKSPIEKDTVYREIMINPKTGLRACHIHPDYQFEVFEFWPSDILKIFHEAGINKRTPPQYEAHCQISHINAQGNAPVITSPKTHVHYAVQNEPVDIPLSAIVEADVTDLHWFANDIYLGHNSPEQLRWWRANPGRYTIRAVDDFGRADALDIMVIKTKS